MLCFNFFFLPPVGTLTIADPQNWVALVRLPRRQPRREQPVVGRARRARSEALARRDEVARLFDLSRDVLLITDSREAIAPLARFIARRFDLDYVAICLPRAAEWDVFDAGRAATAARSARAVGRDGRRRGVLEFDANARTYAGTGRSTVDGHDVRLVPLRLGTRADRPARGGRPARRAGTLDALAGVAAIAIERAQFLDERKAAELSRQSEELKSALLASLGARPAHAADGDPRRGEQPAGVLADRRASGASRASWS